MAKVCPSCGNQNKETSVFCEKCGAFLDYTSVKKSTSGGLSWGDRQNLLVHGNLGIILLPAAIILLLIGFMIYPGIYTSDITSPSGNLFEDANNTYHSGIKFSFVSHKTFSDGSILFNYTGKFANNTNKYTEDNGWITTELNGEDNSIQIKKNTVIKDPYTAQQEGDNLNINKYLGEVLSHTTGTNPQDIKIFKSVTKFDNQFSMTDTISIELYFKDKNNVVYAIKVYNYNEDIQNVTKLADEIFNSLNLN